MATTDTQEIVDMMAFDRLEPFGAYADEVRLGQIGAAVYNVHRVKKDDPIVHPWQLMPALRKARGIDDDAEEAERVVIGADLSADELSALIDARMFGRVAPGRGAG